MECMNICGRNKLMITKINVPKTSIVIEFEMAVFFGGHWNEVCDTNRT